MSAYAKDFPGALMPHELEERKRLERERREAEEAEQAELRAAVLARARREGERKAEVQEAQEERERVHADGEDRLRRELNFALAEVRRCSFEPDLTSTKATRQTVTNQARLTAAMQIAQDAEQRLHSHQASTP